MTRCLLLILGLVLVPGAALAEPPSSSADPASAQGLFYDARALMTQRRFTEACPKLEESLRLDPGLGTQFNLADCNEQIGRIATAWAGFLEVAAQAKAINQHERARIARNRAAALEARVPKLVVEASGAPLGLELKRDGVVIGSSTWGTPIPVDPGVHKVSASAPGKQTWETTIAAIEGRTTRVSVPRDYLEAPVTPAAPVAGPNVNGADQRVTSIATTTPLAAPVDIMQSYPPPAVENAGATQRTLGWIVMGMGVGAVGVGAGFGLASLSKRDESGDHCVVDACDSTGIDLRGDAIRYGNVATIATLAGGAAIAGGLILVLTAPRDQSPARAGRIRAAPSIASGGGGFTLQGSFQ